MSEEDVVLLKKLYTAIINDSVKHVSELIALGVNPLYSIEFNSGGIRIPLVDAAMGGNLLIFNKLIQSPAIKLADFAKLTVLKNQIFQGPNIIQRICLDGSLDMIKAACNIIKNKEELLALFQSDITYINKKGIPITYTFVEILLKDIRTSCLMSSGGNHLLDMDKYTLNKMNHKVSLLDKWFRGELNLDYLEPLEQNADGTLKNETETFIWTGRKNIFEYLINTLDVIDLRALSTTSSLPFNVYISDMADIYPQDIDLIKKHMINDLRASSRTVKFAEDVEDTLTIREQDDLPEIEIFLSNLKSYKLKVKIALDFKPVNDIVQAALAKKDEREKNRKGSIDNMKVAVATHALRLDKTEQTLSSLPDARIKEIRACMADSPKVLECFNKVYTEAHNLLRARNIASTKLFTTKPTKETAQMAQIAQNIFTVIGEGIPLPFVNIIPAITGSLLDKAVASQINAQNAAVTNAASNTDEKLIATDVAAIIAAEYMKQGHFKDPQAVQKLAGLVVERINNLNKYESRADLVGFLCSAAINSIHPKNRKKSHSDDSNSTPVSEGSDKGIGIAAIENDNKKKVKSAGCFPFLKKKAQ